MIEIRDLYKYYGERRAVGPLTADIQKGEIVGLLGLNGAGKTTTLRILACDLLPTSGTVRVGGLDVVESPHEVRGKVGYLPDTPPVYPEMTVEEYLDFAAKLRGVSAADLRRRVGEAMEQTEIAEERSTPIFALSHGYRQRVGIAQAIVHRPEFVVLDEPISGLDPVQIVEMRSLVRSLGGDHTVVVSSHILNEISETCDRILVIRDGEIVASGNEAELSARWLRGMRLEITLAGSDDAERALELLRSVSGVTLAERAAVETRDGGAHELVVGTEKDVRRELAAALVQGGYGLLELRRGERELETVFLELARSGTEAAARKKKKRKLSAPAKEAS